MRVVDIFKIQKFIVITKFSRRKSFKNSRRFKRSLSTKFENEFKNELTNKNDQLLNIVMIDVAIFHRLIRKKNQNKFQLFFIIMQQIVETLIKFQNILFSKLLKVNITQQINVKKKSSVNVSTFFEDSKRF